VVEAYLSVLANAQIPTQSADSRFGYSLDSNGESPTESLRFEMLAFTSDVMASAILEVTSPQLTAD
jgi:hypothetical protein